MRKDCILVAGEASLLCPPGVDRTIFAMRFTVDIFCATGYRRIHLFAVWVTKCKFCVKGLHQGGFPLPQYSTKLAWHHISRAICTPKRRWLRSKLPAGSGAPLEFYLHKLSVLCIPIESDSKETSVPIRYRFFLSFSQKVGGMAQATIPFFPNTIRSLNYFDRENLKF